MTTSALIFNDRCFKVQLEHDFYTSKHNCPITDYWSSYDFYNTTTKYTGKPSIEVRSIPTNYTLPKELEVFAFAISTNQNSTAFFGLVHDLSVLDRITNYYNTPNIPIYPHYLSYYSMFNNNKKQHMYEVVIIFNGEQVSIALYGYMNNFKQWRLQTTITSGNSRGVIMYRRNYSVSNSLLNQNDTLNTYIAFTDNCNTVVIYKDFSIVGYTGKVFDSKGKYITDYIIGPSRDWTKFLNNANVSISTDYTVPLCINKIPNIVIQGYYKNTSDNYCSSSIDYYCVVTSYADIDTIAKLLHRKDLYDNALECPFIGIRATHYTIDGVFTPISYVRITVTDNEVVKANLMTFKRSWEHKIVDEVDQQLLEQLNRITGNEDYK